MGDHEHLLKERLALLEEISERRNGLLRQLYDLVKRDDDAGYVLAESPRQDADVEKFLGRFDLKSGPGIVSIADLPDTWFQLPSTPPPSDPDVKVETPNRTSPYGDQEPSPLESPPQDEPVDSLLSRSSSPMVVSAVPEPDKDQDERRSLSRIRTASASPKSYTQSSDVGESIEEVDLTEHPTLSHSHSPPDVSVDSAPMVGPGDNLLPPPTYEADQDADDVGEDVFHSPQNRDFVAPEQAIDEPPFYEVEMEATVEEVESRPMEDLPDSTSRHVSLAAEEVHGDDLDEDIVPPTHMSELEDSASVTQESLPELTLKKESVDSTVPVDFGYVSEDATMELDDMEETHSHSSIEALSPCTPPLSPTPISISIPAQMSRPVIQAPSPIHETNFNFDDILVNESMAQASKSPIDNRVYFNPHYNIPLLHSLPPEFQRKKTARQQRKRDKEKDRGESKKDDWAPLGMNRWRALLRANPTWKHVAKSSKSLTTKDWNVALTELRLIRTFDRIELLKDNGRWSFRQPKKQRGVGGLVKTHWDYLLDEMKWMCIDFREERKWKIALAYTLANAVQEWHAAGSVEERMRRGICVIWPKSLPEDTSGVAAEEEDTDAMVVGRDDSEEAVQDGSVSIQMGDYGSDDGSDDDQEKDQGDVVDQLDTNSLVQDALTQQDRVEPKVEDADDFLSSFDLQQPDPQEQKIDSGSGQGSSRQDSQENDPVPPGLKPASQNPVLQSAASRAAFAAATIFLREKIAYLDATKLFLDLDDLEADKPVGDPTAIQNVVDTFPSFPDLSVLFPDLQPYGLLDVVPAVIQLDGKKNRRERDDPNKRTEDTTYSKLTPVSKFMHCRPTLVGPLQPSKHWKDGRWHNLDDIPIYPNEGSRQLEASLCSLFERSLANQLVIKPPDKRIPEPRIAEQLWTPTDDSILSNMVELYHSNWLLVADALNTSRRSVSTDRRSAWDCYHRWTLLTSKSDSDPPTSSVSNMPNRPKRHAVINGADSTAANSNTSIEARKRRRHFVLQEAIRKVMRKRENIAKAAANQKRQTAVHDTHGQYNKMPKLTPQELGQRKIEKEYQDRLTRQRGEELRTKTIREQQARIQQGGQTTATPPSAPSRAAGTALPASPVVPPIRSQVNISQQQRISNPMVAASNAARLSPQHQQAVQAQARAMAAAQQAQVQAQTQGLVQGQQPQPQTGQAMNGTHLSPTLSYTNRSSSSPSMSQASPPPRAPSTTGTPVPSSSNRNSATPRPPSTQPLLGAHPAHAQLPSNIVRAAPTGLTNLPHYYGNVNIGGQQFTTTEQMEQALRLQTLLQARQRQQIPQTATAANTQQLPHQPNAMISPPLSSQTSPPQGAYSQ